MRGTPTFGPNSPRETGLGLVMPRAIHPEIASKSKVRHTIERLIAELPRWCRRDYSSIDLPVRRGGSASYALAQ